MANEKSVHHIETLLHKLPPQDLDAEQSICGAILLDNDAIGDIIELLAPEDFYREGHHFIFQAMRDLYERRDPIDLVTVTAELKKMDKLDIAGGLSYLSQLVDRLPTAAHVRSYAKLVKQKALLRGLIRVSTDVVSAAYDPTSDVDSLVDQAEKEIFDIRQNKNQPGFSSLNEIIKDNFKVLEELYEKKQSIIGLSTRYADLDEMTSGLHAGDLIIIAGRPSMGKTAFGLNIAENVAVETGRPVAVFSLEMSKEQLAQRLLCSQARVDNSQLRRGQVTEDDWMRITHAAGRLSEAPLYIDDTPAINPLEMRAKVRRLMRQAPISLIMVDYLQLMRGIRRTDNREQEISEISRSLKAMAKEMGVPVIALSQLNRSLEARKDRRPQMSDLRECVVGDTLVMLADGRRKPIRDLVGTTPQVLAMEKNGQIIHAQADKVWLVGVRKVYRLALASGRVLNATARHRLYTGNGWQRLEALVPGDRVGVFGLRLEPACRLREQLQNKKSNPNVDTLPNEVFEEVRAEMAAQGISQRRMASMRGTSYGGASHFRFEPSRETVHSYASVLKSDSLKAMAESQLFWDRVVSIESAGEEDVYDLTVPGPASWLADGIVSHNSGAIEQDADIIAFIYRDEVYNPDSPDKGIAEIIISKQRNGPIGTVRLAFMNQYTRFENFSAWQGG